MRMLVSVRSVAEAALAVQGGADFIDLKEPGAGALGGLPLATVRGIVQWLRLGGVALPVSATIGDHPMSRLAEVMARVQAVGECAVDYVKVGIEPGPCARSVLDALAASGWSVVPVFIADPGLDPALIAHACSLPFPALMLDTADKRAGSLFDALPVRDVAAFVAQVRAAGRLAGVAGALRASHAATLRRLAPDFAGFRSALCDGERTAGLSLERLRALRELLREDQLRPAQA